jgi:hypothetical protein
MAKPVDEMPLQRGSIRTESEAVRKVHGIAEVKPVLIDVTDGTGKRETLLAFIAGDSMVVVENDGKQAQQWLKDAVLAKLRNRDGVEQA